MSNVDHLLAVVTSLPVLAPVIGALIEVVDRETQCVAARDSAIAFSEVEHRLISAVDDVARAALAVVLAAAAPSPDRILVDQVVYQKLTAPSKGVYFSLRGPIELNRHLYRSTAERNGPTVDPIALQLGIVDGRWLPAAAEAVGRFMQETTARDAVEICEVAATLPYSRSAFLRLGESLGEAWDVAHAEIENDLMDALEVPESASSVSLGIDRVSLPMNERAQGGGVAYRMAWCAVLTLHDDRGLPLYVARYGAMPTRGRDDIEESLVGDLRALRTKRADLDVVTLADGAPEMQQALDRVIVQAGCEAYQAIDFWHVAEHIAQAIVAVGRDPKTHLPAFKELLANDRMGAARIEQTLRAWRKERGPHTADALDATITYLSRNRDRMRYVELRDAGLPIGSGSVEATCKTLVSTRMKRSGARWTTPGGQAILGLRALAKSSRWDGAMPRLLATYCTKVTPLAAAA